MASIIEGYSDDTVMVSHEREMPIEIPCWESAVEITFDDGTRVRAEYVCGAWNIEILEAGTAWWCASIKLDGCGDKATDVLYVGAEISHWELVGRR